MHLAVIADAYPPMKTSGAVQIRDLVAELSNQGHEVTVLLPDSSLETPWHLAENENITVLRLRAPATKDVGYFRRAIAEYRLSGIMYRNLKQSPLAARQWQGIISYSPTIFFGPLVRKLRRLSACGSYLILRDIFPEWAVDMGLLGRGFIYRYFKSVEKFQYRQADTIGVQTASNLGYFRNEHGDLNARVEVLNNWLAPAMATECSINTQKTALAGRKIFVYTGNIGIAQGMEILIELANALRDDESVGFLFVGRGTAVERIKNRAAEYGLKNTVFHDEIAPEHIPGLLSQCQVGLIALDPRHRNDNIPGKFLAYMQAGLPVLANINAGNDLEKLIVANQVGEVSTSNSLPDLRAKANTMLSESGSDAGISDRCRRLAEQEFSPRAAVKQVVRALSDNAAG